MRFLVAAALLVLWQLATAAAVPSFAQVSSPRRHAAVLAPQTAWQRALTPPRRVMHPSRRPNLS